MENKYKSRWIQIIDREEFARRIKKAGELLVCHWSTRPNDEGQYADCIVHQPAKVAVKELMDGYYDWFVWDAEPDCRDVWLRCDIAPAAVRRARRIDLLARRNTSAAKLIKAPKLHNADWAQRIRGEIAERAAEIAALKAAIPQPAAA
jgi:hypothetical protein